ncbi:hypothetical protein LINPERPRIM_LOCUS22371 [Linum perenne]
MKPWVRTVINSESKCSRYRNLTESGLFALTVQATHTTIGFTVTPNPRVGRTAGACASAQRHHYKMLFSGF